MKLEVGVCAQLQQHRALPGGDPVRFGEIDQTSLRIAGVQTQKAAQPVEFGCDPALTVLDLGSDRGKIRKSFFDPMRFQTAADEDDAPGRQ